MKFKPVPEPPESLDFVAEVHRAVPLVPDTSESCCARVMARTGVPSEDEARRWLTFLRALGLARETERGFTRERREFDPEDVAERFEAHVFGAEDVLAILADADDPLDADAVFAAFREVVPNWERHHEPDSWEDDWRERVERILAWAALVGLAERAEGGYRLAE